MFHELEIIDDFVLNKLNPLNCISESPEVLVEWLTILQTEEHNIKTKIAEDALKLPNETHIEVFIHNIQLRLTTLAEKLYSYQGFNEVTFDFSNNDPLSLSKLQKFTYQTIEDIIDYLRTHFDRFFLFDEKPPRRRVLITALQFTQNINDLQGLSDKPNVFLKPLYPPYPISSKIRKELPIVKLIICVSWSRKSRISTIRILKMISHCMLSIKHFI